MGFSVFPCIPVDDKTGTFTSMDKEADLRSPSPSPSEKEESDVAGSVFLISERGELLRLPIPSTSPRDPLAWTWFTRITSFVFLVIFAAFCSVTFNLPSVTLPGLENEFPNQTEKLFTVKSLNSAMTLFTSIGYLIAIPCSIAVGRRPVVLVTAALMSLMVLWGGLAGDFWQLMVATCFQGLSVGSALGMCSLMVMDATFIHERPYAFSIFFAVSNALVSIMLMPVPWIFDPTTQWRPLYQVWFGPCLAQLAVAVFFLPETYFVRPAIALDGRVLVQSSSEKVQIYENWEAMPCGPHCPHMNHLVETAGPSKWAQRLKVQRAPGTSWKGAGATWLQIVLCVTNPLLVWVSLLAAAVLSGSIFIGLVLPDHLLRTLDGKELEMYSIYLGLSGILGSLLAIPATGPLITWCIKYFTKHSGGTRHAEVYLPGFVLPVISGALSVGLFGLAKKHDWSTATFYLSSALSSFSFVAANVAVILWITEAFQPWAASSLALQQFTANIVAFGVGVNLLAWVNHDDAELSIVVIVTLILIFGAFAVPVAFYGKTVRQYLHGRWSESEKGAIRPH
ncbi:MFS general substrate transporter [Sarocladium strictum]